MNFNFRQHYNQARSEQSQAPAYMQPAQHRQPRQRPVPASHHVQQQQQQQHPSYAPVLQTQADYHAPPTQTLNQQDAGTTRRPAWMGTLRVIYLLFIICLLESLWTKPHNLCSVDFLYYLHCGNSLWLTFFLRRM